MSSDSLKLVGGVELFLAGPGGQPSESGVGVVGRLDRAGDLKVFVRKLNALLCRDEVQKEK